MSFGKQLQRARTAAGYTQKQIAEMLGVSKSTITSWESDLREPDIEKIKKLTAILNVSAETLLEIEKASEPDLSDSEANEEECIEILVDMFGRLGWLDASGDVPEETLKIIRGVFLMLDEIFGN